jgi:tRNA(adenine34) deaminase
MCYNDAVDDAGWMRLALVEAEQALAHGDVPVGAVAVRDGTVLGWGHNRKETDANPTAHAEMLAIQQAARTLGGWRLIDVTLYCTLEPCPMCAGAMWSARLPRLVYAVDDPKAGAVGSVVELLRDPRFNHQVSVTRGVLAEEAQDLLERFFARLRGSSA